MTTAHLFKAISLATVLALAGASAGWAAEPTWVASWSASPAPSRAPNAVLQNETVREIVHTTAGGREVRLRLSNAYGTAPLRLDAVSLALRETGASIRPGSSAPVTFQGERAVTIAPGAFVLSDPLTFEVPAQSDLAVSLYVAGPASASTAHDFQRDAVYFVPGDATEAAAITPTARAGHRPGVAVAGSGGGLRLGRGGRGGRVRRLDHRRRRAPAETHGAWPDVLYARLHEAGVTRFSVVNAGIGGDRLLHPGTLAFFGDAGLARFDRDVLAQPNVRAVIIYLGINDIGHVGAGVGPEQYVSAEDLGHGLAQLAERAHEQGVKVYVATLAPFKPCTIPGYYSETKEAERQALNAWIRQAKVIDGVADFDRALEDPAAPGQMRPLYDFGDHLHPSAAGHRALAEAVPLDWFR